MSTLEELFKFVQASNATLEVPLEMDPNKVPAVCPIYKLNRPPKCSFADRTFAVHSAANHYAAAPHLLTFGIILLHHHQHVPSIWQQATCCASLVAETLHGAAGV